jgi:hypothetical protein
MKFNLILKWWRRKLTPPLKHLHVLMYTRQGCHLCEEAWRCLQEQQGRYYFTLEQRDVDADPALAAEFGEWVPVVAVNGAVRFRGGVNPVLLRRLLDGEVAALRRQGSSV